MMEMIIDKYHIVHPKQDYMTDDELYDFCVANRDLHIERDKYQNIIIMSPVGGMSGYFEKEAIRNLGNWEFKYKLGKSFSSSTGFLLPNGAMRSPDASWMSDERWESIPKDKRQKFLPVVPDFVIEIRSASDNIKPLKAKMLEWIENGVRLAWMINTKDEQVIIYRENGSIEIIENFDGSLSGEDVLEGFEMDLSVFKGE